MAIDIKTVILHCKTLSDRKQHMIHQMKKHAFTDYSFYEDFDGNELTDDIIKQYCCRKVDDWNTVVHKLKIYEKMFPEVFTTQRELSPPQISLTIKHGKVYQALSKIDSEYFMILEDDSILCDDFENKLHHYLEQTPKDWDVIYIGRGCNLHPKNITADKLVYKMDHPCSRCTEAMLMKKTTVSQLANTWFPFHLVVDWELAYQQYLHSHNIYWWEPSIVIQGSVCGMYDTTLR